ncbi:MAG: hypothetical protein ABII71_02520 [Candidatus Micrarchaeota archaeon]
MRARVSLLFIIILVTSLFIVSFAAPLAEILDLKYEKTSITLGVSRLIPFLGEECVVCEVFANAPNTGLLVFMDETFYTVDMTVYYENESESPPRQPVTDAMMIVYMYNDTGIDNGLWKVYTDGSGQAAFDFSAWAGGEATFKILYCPFCCPGDGADEWCGWDECLQMAEIPGPATPSMVPMPAGESAPADLNCNAYKPSLQVLEYTPPPTEPTAGVPALCSIGLLIFSLLGGALYLSGSNPFGGFNIGAPRMGRHIRYQARSRGWALDTTALASSVRTAVNQGKQIKKMRSARKDKDGKVIAKGMSGWATFKAMAKQGSPFARWRRVRNAAKGLTPGGGAQTEVVDGQVRITGGGSGSGGKSVREIMGKQYRESRAYLRGGQIPGGETRTMDRRERGRAYGIFLAKSLGQLALGLIDRSTIGYILGLNLEQRMMEALSETERESRAVAIAAYEHVLELLGDGDENEIVVRGNTVTVEGVGECTAIETTITIPGQANPTTVRILVRAGDEAAIRQALATGNVANLSCMLEVRGEGNQLTRYDLREGSLHEIHQVYTHTDARGQTHETVVILSPSSQDGRGTLSVAGAIVDGERYTAVAGEGDHVNFFRREADGELAASPSFNAGTTMVDGRRVGAVSMLEGGAADAIRQGIALSGTTMEDAGFISFQDRGGGDTAVTERLRAVLDSNTSMVTEQYNDQLGQIETERRGLFYEGLAGDDLTVRVADSSAAAGGEPRERALANGTEIRISDGNITRVTGADGQAIAGVSVDGGRITGLTTPDGEQLRINVAGDTLLRRDAAVLGAVQDLIQAVGHYDQVMQEGRVERGMEQQYHPDQVGAVTGYAEARAGAPASAVPEPGKGERQSADQRVVAERTREVLAETPHTDAGTPDQAKDAQVRALARTEPALANLARLEAAAVTLRINPDELTPERLVDAVGSLDEHTPQDARRAFDARVASVAQERGISPERARTEVLAEYQDRLIQSQEGHPLFNMVYEERAVSMASDIPPERRIAYFEAVGAEERRTAGEAYTDTATRLFRRAEAESPLSQFGLRIADMSADDARAGLAALGLERREVRSIMRDFSDVQESARQYRSAASDAAARATTVTDQATSARGALLTFVPTYEQLTTVIPREKDETAEAYRGRVEDFRRDTAGQMATALEHDRRTDTAAELATDDGRRAALAVCNRVLVGSLDAAAEEHGGRVEGYQRQRFYAQEDALFDRMIASARSYLTEGRMGVETYERTPDGRVESTWQEGNIVSDYTAFIATTQIDAAAREPIPGRVEKGARVPRDEGRTEMPNSIFSTATDAITQYLSGNPSGRDTPPPAAKGEPAREVTHAEQEGAIHLFRDAAVRADQYVASQGWGARRDAARDQERREAEVASTLEATKGIGIDYIPQGDYPAPTEPRTAAEKRNAAAARRATDESASVMADLRSDSDARRTAEVVGQAPEPEKTPARARRPEPEKHPEDMTIDERREARMIREEQQAEWARARDQRRAELEEERRRQAVEKQAVARAPPVKSPPPAATSEPTPEATTEKRAEAPRPKEKRRRRRGTDDDDDSEA